MNLQPNFRPIGLRKPLGVWEAGTELVSIFAFSRLQLSLSRKSFFQSSGKSSNLWISWSGCCFLLNFASFSLINIPPLAVIFHTNSHISLWLLRLFWRFYSLSFPRVLWSVCFLDSWLFIVSENGSSWILICSQVFFFPLFFRVGCLIL